MQKKTTREIVLSATRASWRMLTQHADEGDRRVHAIRDDVLKRDNYRCYFCRFEAKRYQELHHLNDNHNNNSLKNVVTTCCFCHQCFHLGMAGVRSSGVLIWLPEMAQVDLNNVVRALFVANLNNGKHADAANELYRALEARRAIVDLEFGQGASNPAALGQAFLEMDREVYAGRAARLGGLRLLPRQPAFSLQVAYWRSDPNVFGAITDTRWDDVMPQAIRDEIEKLSDPDAHLDADVDGRDRDGLHRSGDMSA